MAELKPTHRLASNVMPLSAFPQEFLDEKKMWNVEAMVAYADADPNVISFGIWEEMPEGSCSETGGKHELIGCLVLVHTPLYNQIIIDTLIVPKRVRTEHRVKCCFQLARALGTAYARVCGVTKCTWSTLPELVDRYRAYLDDDPRLRVGEVILHYDLDPETEREIKERQAKLVMYDEPEKEAASG